MFLTSPFEYFKKTKYQNKTKEQEFLDNSNTYILSGVYSARIPQKIKNNLIQNKLTKIVEPLNFYLNDKFEKNIEEIYKTLIKNHAHDGIYGCSIDSVHRAIEARLNKCEDMLNAILKRLVGNFKTKYAIQNKTIDKIGLFNLGCSKNIKTIEIKLPYKIKNSQIIKKERCFEDELLYDINKIPVTENIKNIYTQLIEISSNDAQNFNICNILKPKKEVICSINKIENENIKLEIKNKKIQIFNKKTNQNLTLSITDIEDLGDSYNYSPSGNYKTYELTKTKVIYDGKIESCLRLYFKNLELDVLLNNKDTSLRFSAKINNKTKNHKLQLVLKLDKNINKTVAQDAFDAIERKIDFDYKMQDYMPVQRPKELKTNSYPMQNFVIANKAIILTKGLHEYEVYQNKLRICLLRSFSTISNPKNKTRSIPAGPDLKTPEGQCLQSFVAEFAISFGNKEKAFNLIDDFFKNYVAIDGEFEKNIKINTKKIPDAQFIYVINNKKIIYLPKK